MTTTPSANAEVLRPKKSCVSTSSWAAKSLQEMASEFVEPGHGTPDSTPPVEWVTEHKRSLSKQQAKNPKVSKKKRRKRKKPFRWRRIDAEQLTFDFYRLGPEAQQASKFVSPEIITESII